MGHVKTRLAKPSSHALESGHCLCVLVSDAKTFEMTLKLPSSGLFDMRAVHRYTYSGLNALSKYSVQNHLQSVACQAEAFNLHARNDWYRFESQKFKFTMRLHDRASTLKVDGNYDAIRV